MKTELNNELIRAVKDKMLADRNIVSVLMETLSIGKEATYRRLRGDVPFSFYEVVLIAKALGLSLDEIAGNSVTHGAMFSMNLQKTENPFDYIYGIAQSYYTLYLYVQGVQSGKVSNASSNLPFVYYSGYKMLAKFRFCRWLHQAHGAKFMPKMEAVQIPEDLSDMMQQISDMHKEVRHTTLLWDKNIFKVQVDDIRFFAEMGLVSKEEVELLKEELFTLLDDADDIACRGAYRNGNKVDIYISSINFETSYTHVEKDNFHLGIFHLFAIDYIYSENPEICMEQKLWIDSLKRYATLISQCSEKERLKFFREQREYIATL
ncbi:hypothetical protein LJC38_05970 [Parabacteroides sp. OttesenSCG-928-K15]|nr:hypothetical protein [Parabacteroides sp. OttesenSCG-928-K15]